ncbi:MAG TPA: hypothetical protein VK454_08780, partial [Myxococcaceae bacterium]|nr:hypothetical protein [Myxococcaceae bacterium]
EPFSRITEGCFTSPPEVVGRVDTRLVGVTAADGGTPGGSVRETVLASGVRIGERPFGDLQALRDPGAACELTLGSEVLLGLVLEVSPAKRTVTFHAQMPAPAPFQSEEPVSLELTRDPRTDRPSLAVQLDTGGRPLTLPMVLATASAQVDISADAARALAGREPSGPSFGSCSLALAPGWVLRHVDIGVAASSAPSSAPALTGVLGAEAWGHYRILVDLGGQRLVLFRRPVPVEGRSGAQSWAQLSSDPTPSGSVLKLISWETLERGALIPLEPSRVHLRNCRIGLTLAPEDPGASLEVTIPWAGLEKDLPECAKELAAVPGWTGELQESGPRPCQGTCLYAQETIGGRTLCSCGRGPPAPALPSVRTVAPKTSQPVEAEPTDPGDQPARPPRKR